MKETVSPRLVLVGTAHVSRDSVEEVRRVIGEERPEVVAVELDAGRRDALENRRQWEETPIHRLLKSDKLWLFLTQSLLASYQRRLGEQLGVEPGEEMLAAIRTAEVLGAQVILADREIGLTMKRAYAHMRFREKVRLLWEFFRSMFGGEEQEPVDLEKMMQEDTITQMMNELGRIAPSIKQVVIDERDAYLSTMIRRPAEAGRKVVAVVGAGHLAGIRRRLQEPPADLAALSQIPRKRVPVGKILGWVLPLAIVALFLYLGYDGYREGNFGRLRDAALYWALITGTFAAGGALLARGHLLSIATAFVAAPFTTLHPALAAGWFAGIVEAWVREPLVRDFQGLSRIKTGKDFFDNRVIRVLMVAALANVGATIGFFVAGAEIVRRFSGA